MGLAVLPSRLKEEMMLLEEAVTLGKSIDEIKEDKRIGKFSNLYESLLKCKDSDHRRVKELVKESIGLTFVTGLEHAGVF